MKKKLNNPFAGKPIRNTHDSPDLEEFSDEEIFQAMKELKDELGEEEFARLMAEAMRLAEKEEGLPENEFADDLDDDDLDVFFDPDEVTAREWGATHPANLTCGSDVYYADLANDLTNLISGFHLPPNAPRGLARELGRVLAAYLEDLVSGTRIFSAMRRVCMQRYGYRLPFYDCGHPDYMPDHINEEDIRFLIWKTACQLGIKKEMTYSPLASGWALIAEKVFDLLNARYEDAPEANRVADWLRRAFRKGDYIDIREVANWLVFRNPLAYFPDLLDDVKSAADQILTDDRYDARNVSPMIYGYMAKQSWQRSMSAMGAPSKTLVAAIATELGYDAIAKEIEAIEVLPEQIYAISQDKKTRKIFFETTDHKKFEVKRESFAKGFRPAETQFALCNLVLYHGEYLLNGTLSGGPDLKPHWEKQQILQTFEQQREYAASVVDKLNGQQVLCVSSLQTFLNKIGMSSKGYGKFSGAKNYVVLVSKEMGIAILPDMGYAFGIPGNRFFRKRAAAKDSFADIVFHNSMPHDVAIYMQQHSLLPEACIGASQGKDVGRQIVQDYLAFWIGFYCELPAYGNDAKTMDDDSE